MIFRLRLAHMFLWFAVWALLNPKRAMNGWLHAALSHMEAAMNGNTDIADDVMERVHKIRETQQTAHLQRMWQQKLNG